MPHQREPIFHDRQALEVIGPLTLQASPDFTPIPGVSFTSKDLGEPGDYIITVVAELEHDKNNSLIEIRICVDEICQEDKDFFFGPNSADDPKTLVANGKVSNVTPGKTVTAEWRTDKDTATLRDISFVMDGIPESRLI